MAEQNAEQPAASVQKVSGIRTVLRYTGIPTSWLDKRPKLPSRNWLIFLSVTSSITGYYIYDRQQCKKIRQEYTDRVKAFSELPSGPLDKLRKVTVYGSKWPGDEDYDQSLKHFRKYVKPILVAAAVDYEMVGSKRLGELSNQIASHIQRRRRLDLGIDSEPEATKALPTYEPLPQARQRELEGGIIIIGRPTLKEFLHGVYRGWNEGLQKIDADEVLARELEDDGSFDELGEFEPGAGEIDKSSPPTQHKLPANSPIQIAYTHPPPTLSSPSQSGTLNALPSEVFQLPPILLVPFTDHIGFTQIPLMVWDFFNQRRKVRSGSEAAFNLVMNHTRPILPPSTDTQPSGTDKPPSISQGDLDFDKVSESYIKKSLHSIPEDIEKARKKYYEELPGKLKTARALARGTREPTKEELSNPPPTEVELRQERLNKERRWRGDLAGWSIVKPGSLVTWDDRFQQAIRIFTSLPSSDAISS